MRNQEEEQLNHPVKQFFEKKLKCAVSRSEFRFSAGKLDVLAYDRKNKCFHICEGKRASNVASVGHAVGQLVAYISMIQEGGYNFLNRISKEERLELSDFTTFLENRAIDICFYVALPQERKEKLLNAAQLMLNNMGDFGNSIGIFFASKNKCNLEVTAKPLSIKIRRTFDDKEFLDEIKSKFLKSKESEGIVENNTNYPNVIQLKENKGHSALHYEVWLRKIRKTDVSRIIEIAFHLEFAEAHLKDLTAQKRKKKLKNVLSKASKELKKKGFDFKYQSQWGKQWSRVYSSYKTNQLILDDQIFNDVLNSLRTLVSVSKPMFEKINWGRLRKQEEDLPT